MLSRFSTRYAVAHPEHIAKTALFSDTFAARAKPLSRMFRKRRGPQSDGRRSRSLWCLIPCSPRSSRLPGAADQSTLLASSNPA